MEVDGDDSTEPSMSDDGGLGGRCSNEMEGLMQHIDPMGLGVIQFTALDQTDNIENSTRYQVDTFCGWFVRTLRHLNFTWDVDSEPCPVMGLLTVLEISGTPKGRPVGNSSVIGCGQSYSQLKKIRQFVTRINEEHGFTIRQLHPDDHPIVFLRGEPLNSGHNTVIKRCMRKYRKQISRREVQSQAFLRHHLILARNILMEMGFHGLMNYTAILVSFWLALRVGVALSIKIENIQLGQQSDGNLLGLPSYLKISIKLQKTSHSYKVFRLWCYADVDVEVCPVFHVYLLLKLSGWTQGYLFRRPFEGVNTGSLIFCYSQIDPLPMRSFYDMYRKVFSSIFYDTEDKLSCHGPRRSQAQLMDRCGFAPLHIMAQCLWKKYEEALKYIANSRVDLELLPEEHRREFPRPKPIHK